MRLFMHISLLGLAISTGVWACSPAGDSTVSSPAIPSPQADHHKHLFSPQLYELVRELRIDRPSTELLIAEMDAAGVERAVVLSVAYIFTTPRRDPVEDAVEKARAENDWVARETERFPERLVAFCGLDALQDYAADELERCARMPGIRGLKLHFAAAMADVLDAGHVERLRGIFAAANSHGLAIVVHTRPGPEYGAEHAEAFLNRVLPASPDVPVQIAHLWGGGWGPGSYNDDYLAVLAEAVSAGDPRTRNLFFDVAEAAETANSDEQRQAIAARIREIGLDRILWGSDSVEAGVSWARFLSDVPLTDDEFGAIAANVAPYLR